MALKERFVLIWHHQHPVPHALSFLLNLNDNHLKNICFAFLIRRLELNPLSHTSQALFTFQIVNQKLVSSPSEFIAKSDSATRWQCGLMSWSSLDRENPNWLIPTILTCEFLFKNPHAKQNQTIMFLNSNCNYQLMEVCTLILKIDVKLPSLP